MKKLLAFVGLILAFCQPAFSQTETVDIWAAGDTSPDLVTLSSMGNGQYGFDYTGTDQSVKESFVVGGKPVTMNLTELVFDSDPSVRFAFGVNNPDGATGLTPYSFTFTTPVVASPSFLTAGPYTVSSSIGVTLTAGINGSSTPVTLDTPSTGGDVMQNFIGTSSDTGGKQNAGVDLIGSELAFTPSLTGSNSQTFNIPASPTLNFNLNYDASQISVTTAFQLSNSDSASFSGRFDVDDVAAAPEPRSIGLGLICVGAFALLIARRQRA